MNTIPQLSSHLIAIALFLCLSPVIIPINGQSGNDTTFPDGDEDCKDYDILWFIQQYDKRILTKPYFHIGVNISLPQAASTKHWEFRQLLRQSQYRKLLPHEVCSTHLPTHPQQFGQACGWSYRCDYNPHRFPAYIFQAHCENSYWGDGNECKRVYYPVPILSSTGCNPLTSKKDWVWKQELVSIACA